MRLTRHHCKCTTRRNIYIYRYIFLEKPNQSSLVLAPHPPRSFCGTPPITPPTQGSKKNSVGLILSVCLSVCHSRPVSDGRVLPERGAERGDLLGHPLHLGGPEARPRRVVQRLDGLGAVQGEHLRMRVVTSYRFGGEKTRVGS